MEQRNVYRTMLGDVRKMMKDIEEQEEFLKKHLKRLKDLADIDEKSDIPVTEKKVKEEIRKE